MNCVSLCGVQVSTKDTVIKSLISLGVKSQRFIKGKGCFMWDILLPTSANWEAATNRKLITKDLILRIEYESRQRTKVSVYEVPPQIIGKHLAAYLCQFRQILNISSNELTGGWRHIQTHFFCQF